MHRDEDTWSQRQEACGPGLARGRAWLRRAWPAQVGVVAEWGQVLAMACPRWLSAPDTCFPERGPDSSF